MNGLILSIVFGALLFLVFVAYALRGLPEAGQEVARDELRRIIGLRGLAFRRPDLLFRACDYELIVSRAELRGLRNQLRGDRRELVQTWLALLAEDVKTLWRFRRFLARQGIAVGVFEEARVATTAALALFWLIALRFLVACLGPFAVANLLGRARGLVEATLHLSAHRLGQLPQAAWPEVQRRWSEEAA